MKDAARRLLTTFFFILIATGIPTAQAEAASDPRFFGTYCGNHEEHFTIRVWCCFGKHWFVVREERRTYTISVRANANYGETRSGKGLVSGNGTAIGEEVNLPFVFSGVVTGRGELKGSAIAPGREPISSTAFLSEDGNAVSLSAYGRTFTLRKDRCGNSAPTVRILSPETGTDFRWGQYITFSGRVTDTEDDSFPRERLIWTSSRDGEIGKGLSTFSSRLTPGTHTITFSGTDSGGRTSTASIRIQITNNRPNLPRIEEPSAGATFYEGQEIAFRVRATDPEDGYLSGDSLVWSSNIDRTLGTGDLLRRTLSRGNHTITLTATDRAGLSNPASVNINVRPRPAGNTPPTVTITSPTNYYAMGDNTCVTFIAESSDIEDGRLRGASLVWRDEYNDGAVIRRRNLGTGERIDVCNPPAPIADTRHTISVTATDSGGLSTTNSIIVIVIPGGLI